MEQKEFHDVVSIGEARKRLEDNLDVNPRSEVVALEDALGRVTFQPVIAAVDVPPFDRASMDGYALVASDTFSADEEMPVKLKLKGFIAAGDEGTMTMGKGECVGIATGGPMPGGANAVAMVEYTDREKDTVRVYRPVAPGENIMSAGADVMRGEMVIREGTLLTPRETGLLAALGIHTVKVYARPKVAILSTGNEIVEPGRPLGPGRIYDVNARALADMVKENGGESVPYGIVKDDQDALLVRLKEMVGCDIIITSGGTSAGVGDFAYRVIEELGDPGILVHGVAIKPGKPTIIGVVNGKPIIGLPGYPTSALVVMEVFVVPLLREMAGLSQVHRGSLRAEAAVRLHSARGRHEYMLVHLIGGVAGGYRAYPVLKGSGAITTLAEADGYIEVDEKTEMVEESEKVEVRLLSDMIKPADLTIIGSHCLGIDLILRLMGGVQAKVINVGSSGGLAAVRRGESDISGCHLLDETTGTYNLPYIQRLGLTDSVYVVRGYHREQGLVVSAGNPKGIKSVGDLLREDVAFINRNPGSGTRILLDMELQGMARAAPLKELTARIRGYEVEAKSHTAIASAVAHGRADVGLAVKTVAEQYGLDFIPVRDEDYDFVIPKQNYGKATVRSFIAVLASEEFKDGLKNYPGLKPDDGTGKVIHSPKDL